MTTSVHTQTLTTRLWKTPGVWLFVVIAMVGVGVAVRSTMMTWRISHLPDVGFRVTNDLKIVTARADWSPVKAGDQLLEVNGQAVSSGTQALAVMLSQPLGSPLSVVSQRGEERHHGTIDSTPLTWFNALALWGRLFTIVGYIALGITVFVLRPGIRTSWLLFVFAVSFATMLSSFIVFFEDPQMHYRTVSVGLALCLAMATLIALEFPKPLPLGPLPRWAAYVMLITPGVSFFALVTLIPNAEYVVFRTGVAAWQVITMALAVTFTLKQYRSARRGTNAKTFAQSRAILVAQWIGLILPALLDFARRFTWLWTENLWSNCYNSAPFILFVIITVYAAIAHNALEVDRFTAAAFGYAVTIGILTLFFVGVFLLFPLLVGSTFSSENPVILVSIAGVGFIGFRPLHSALKKRIDVAFERQAPDATRMARMLGDLTESVQQQPLDHTCSVALTALSALQPTCSEIWLANTEGTSFECTHSSQPHADNAARSLRAGEPLPLAVEIGAGGLPELCPRAFPVLAAKQLSSRGLAMAAPIVMGGSLKGFVAVGRRGSGLGFRHEDIGFLSAVANQVSIALERAGAEPNRLGRYRLGRRVGVGGMAEVFEAWQRGPGGIERRVALKRPLPDMELDQDFITKFLDEARISTQLQHHNIAQIFEVDVVAGKYFIAMEFIDGIALRQLLLACQQQHVAVPFRVAMNIANSLLSALDYAHTLQSDHGAPMSIVHRDVTPANVLITRRGDVKLVDFGIARAATRMHRTRSGEVQGTVPYMSPEHAGGQQVDARTDVYAAAVVLYELMTQARAFPAGPTAERPKRASECADVPAAIDGVLEKGYAYQVDERYAGAGQMRDALLAAAQGQLASSSEMQEWFARTEKLFIQFQERQREDIATSPISNVHH